jgi:chemotaxis protein CheC
MDNYKLTQTEIKTLEKMANDGAGRASSSLSKLIDQEVTMKTLAVRTLPVEKIVDVIGAPEDMVTTVVMEVRGEADGSMMLIYPQQSAINVADLLAKRELGTTSRLSELDKSALRESGNIISGAFLSSLSNYLDINMVESVPDMATDMLKATIDFVLARFARRESSEAVAFEIDFEMGTTLIGDNKIMAYFVLLLDAASTTKLKTALQENISNKGGT